MRVALIAPPFLPVPPLKYGGTELFLHALCEGLVERGADVSLFSTGDSKACARVRFYHKESIWPPEPMLELQHLGWAMYHAATGGYDLIHVQSPAALAFQNFLGDTPLVYTVHHEKEKPLSRYYHHYPEVSFVFLSYRQKALEFGADDYKVIHHGLIPADYTPSFNEGDYCLFMGRLAEEKGVHFAIDAARMANRRIIVAGAPHEKDHLYFRNEIKPRLELPGVEYVGEVGGEQKTELLRNAYALLFPITWNEPFGLVMIESMLAATPVVGFRKGSTPEVVDEGVTGHLVAAGDTHALAGAIKRAGRIDRRNCRNRAEIRFSHRRMADEYLSHYEQVMQLAQERKLRRA